MGRAITYASKDQYKKAIADYTKALELKPKSAEIFLYRGSAYFRNGDNDLAVSDFNQAISLKADYIQAYINRGYTYLKLEKHQSATEDANQAIKLDPQNPEAYRLSAVIEMKNENYDQAIKDYSQAIQLKPSLTDLFMARAGAYYGAGKLADAELDLENYLANPLAPDRELAQEMLKKVQSELYPKP